MEPTIKPHGALTYHRDGTVSYWDVYRQVWRRRPLRLVVVDREIMTSFSEEERDRLRNRVANFYARHG